MKKIIMIAVLALALGGIVLWQMSRSEEEKPAKETPARTQTIHKLRDKEEITNELKERLKSIKNRKPEAQPVINESRSPEALAEKLAQRDHTRKVVMAAHKLNRLLTNSNSGSPAALRLQGAAAEMLAKRQDGSLKLTNVTCARSFCRLTFQTERLDQLKTIREDFDRQNWPWRGKPYLVHTQNQQPVKPGEVPSGQNPLTLEVVVYVSKSAEQPLPVDRNVQNAR